MDRCSTGGKSATHLLSEKTSASLLSLYMNIFQRRAVNAESYLIVLSQSVYRLRSPDISVLSGNTHKSRSAMTVLQQNSRRRLQEEQKTLGQYNTDAIIWSDQSNTTFILYLIYYSGNMFRFAIESCFVALH